MGKVEVIEAGMLSSVQDLGRFGYRHIGVPCSGAFDQRSCRLGNRLLGNAASDAAIEMTVLGGVYRFTAATTICLTGAVAHDAMISDAAGEHHLDHNTPAVVNAGSVLRVGHFTRGVRGYLCVAGGIAGPLVLRSRSVLVSLPDAGLGRALRSGDVLRYITSSDHAPARSHTVLDEIAPAKVLRIVPSMHTQRFSEAQLVQLCSKPFSVDRQSNRMGVRLKGNTLGGEIPDRVASVGTLTGYVQVPASGDPIVLGVDGPTSGGYPVIACMIEADLSVLAQCAPGEEVRFEWVDPETARAALLELDAMLPPVRQTAGASGIKGAISQCVLLGCDTGEAELGAGRERETELLTHISAVSIACGGHAGDDESMRHAIESAQQHGCVIGAHPSYPDREGFGRLSMKIDQGALARSLDAQLRAFAAHADASEATVSYIKAHGALYHDVARDIEFAHWYWARCARVFPHARFVGPLGSTALNALQRSGVPTLIEGFCDRVYEPDGTLRSRSAGGALIEVPEQAADQAIRLIREHRCDLLCVHSDTPNAIEIARAVSARLSEMGVLG